MSIRVNNVCVGPFYGAIVGARNSFSSWAKSDTVAGDFKGFDFATNLDNPMLSDNLALRMIGKGDRRLMAALIREGEPHCKFLRQIPVMMDITAPLYWWKQMDTYKVGTTTNSTSTMHTLMSAPLTAEDFSDEDCSYDSLSRRMADSVRVNLNTLIGKYNRSEDPEEKEHLFNAVIQLLPEGYNQMRTWSGNYSVLRNIYAQRNQHKLREWRDFCVLLKNLTNSWMVTAGLEGGPAYAEIENG